MNLPDEVYNWLEFIIGWWRGIVCNVDETKLLYAGPG